MADVRLLSVVGDDASAAAVDAVAGRRRESWRDSWRRFEMPASLLKDELDLVGLWLLEKLLLEEGGGLKREENILSD